MSVKLRVNKNVTTNVKNSVNSWPEALKDAQTGLDKAQRLVASWKATIQTCRKRIEEKASWPTQIPNQERS